MAARGGKAKTKSRREPAPSAEALTGALNPLIDRELATIGAIDRVVTRETHPGYVVLLRGAKIGKQASIEQMSSMIRAAGAQPTESAVALETMLKVQSSLARRLGTTPMLRAMRLAEAELVRAYGEVIDRFEGIHRKGLEKCWRRAKKQLAVLTAHIAMRGGKRDVEERLALPMTLDRYFAHGEDRVCFRCLFDRPGKRAPLERSDPHPYTYVCSACHDEVLTSFPPDLADSVLRWTADERESHVIERALGRASKLTAESLILAKMSDVAPDMPPPPLPYKTAEDASPKRRAPAQPRPRVELGGVADAPLEQAYVDALFDYDSVRANW